MGTGAELIIAKLVISAILAYASYQMNKVDPPDDDVAERGTEIKGNTRSTSQPIWNLYGTHRIGGNDVYINTADKHNKTLWIIHCLGEGECDSIKNDDNGNPMIYIDGKQLYQFEIDAEDTSLVSYSFYNGSPTQDITTGSLWAEFTDDNPGYNDNLQNTTFIMWKFKWDQDAFRGVPRREVVLKGKKVYDFRTLTTAWSDNPVLALYDFFTNTRYGLAQTGFSLDSWEEAADYCDTKDFKINYVANVSETASWTIAKNILALFRGTINSFDNEYYLRFADLNEEGSVMTIEDQHIVQDGSGKSSVKVDQPGRFDSPSTLRVTFIDAEKDWTEDSFPIGNSIGVVHDFNIKGCTDRTMAGILGLSMLERLQLDRTISVTLRDDAILLEPHDIVTFNSSSPPISDQVMRVVSANYNSIGFINIGMQYESMDLYNDKYDISLDQIYSVDLPDPSLPTILSNPSVTEVTYYYRLRTFSRLDVIYDIAEYEGWFDHVEVWLAKGTSEESNFKHQFNTSTRAFSIDPVQEGVKYFVKLISVNIWGTKSTFSNSPLLSITVQGQNSPPPSLVGLSAIPGDNSLLLMSDKLDSPDIEAYEFRFGPQWVGGIFMGSYRSPNFSIKNIKPGFFEFTANTFGTNGLYGTIPVYASARIPVPKGYVWFNGYLVEMGGAGEVLDNMEWYEHRGAWYIKCSHTADNLTGTYTSPIINIGAENKNTYFTYIDSLITIIGLGTTWFDIAPEPSTWGDINAETNMWANIIEIDIAPVVNMELHYSDNSTGQWKIITKAEFIAGVIHFQYLKVKIIITDPITEVNAIVGQPNVKLYK